MRAVVFVPRPAAGNQSCNKPTQIKPPVTVHHVVHHVWIICIHACSAYCTSESAKRRSSHLSTVKVSDHLHSHFGCSSTQSVSAALRANRRLKLDSVKLVGKDTVKLRVSRIPAKFASACTKLQKCNGTSTWHTTLAPVLSFQRNISPR